MTANQTIWVTPIAAFSKSLCSDRSSGIEFVIGSAMSRLPPLLPGSIIFPDTATHPPSRSGHKGKVSVFLMHKLPPHARLVTQVKSFTIYLPVRKATLQPLKLMCHVFGFLDQFGLTMMNLLP